MNPWLLLADLLLLFHVAFVLFVVGGLLLIAVGRWRRWGWVRNRWFRVSHAGAMALVVIQSWLGALCPLTTWEMALRQRGGGAVYSDAFIAHWLSTLLYHDFPPWVFVLVYSQFGLAVAVCWWWVRPQRHFFK